MRGFNPYLLQPIENYNEWRMIYFISFLLLVGFFVLNMFVGVVVENFHKCKEALEAEMKEQARKKRLERKLKRQQYESEYGQKKKRRNWSLRFLFFYSPYFQFINEIETEWNAEFLLILLQNTLKLVGIQNYLSRVLRLFYRRQKLKEIICIPTSHVKSYIYRHFEVRNHNHTGTIMVRQGYFWTILWRQSTST